jgi:hypothetical protein
MPDALGARAAPFSEGLCQPMLVAGGASFRAAQQRCHRRWQSFRRAVKPRMSLTLRQWAALALCMSINR